MDIKGLKNKKLKWSHTLLIYLAPIWIYILRFIFLKASVFLNLSTGVIDFVNSSLMIGLWVSLILILLMIMFDCYKLAEEQEKNKWIALVLSFLFGIFAWIFYILDSRGNKSYATQAFFNKKFQWALVGVILLFVLITTSSIRLSNWDLLTDQTTGEKIPLALDPFYFLRISETILEQGGLPDVDVMRYPSANIPFSPEILPQVVVGMYQVGNLFGDYTLREVNVFSPVAFFFVGLILFFFLVYVLTKSKTNAVISTVILAFIPSYLYRTMAGFSDHEAIGMMAFFSAMLVYVMGLKYLEKNKGLIGGGLWGLGVAILSALTIASWGGVAIFLFMIFPLAFLLLWVTKTRKDKNFVSKGILFYSSWLVFIPIFGKIFGFGMDYIINRFMLGGQGIICLFVLGFIIVDALFIKYGGKIKSMKREYRTIYSFGMVLVLGSIALTFLGKNIFSMLASIWNQIFSPFGSGRVGLTVAENAQPYLVDWISQSGTGIFWMFVGGMIFVGFEVARSIQNKKRKFLIGMIWVVMIAGVLFSRISVGSNMNGTNFISQVVYVGSMFIALGFFVWLYFKEEVDYSPELIFIVSWLFFTLISGRAAQRMFFAITPFVCFMAGYFIVKLFGYWKESKEEILRLVIIVLLVVSVFGLAYSVNDFNGKISVQASMQGPSAHYQWQNAMSWVRDNTEEGSIFVHWWDYGHWVTGLGERPVVTDGGHAIGHWDHFIGRYVLTTPYPETAYSFMKTHDVSYLLIDPTDLGKYGAYSKIGSGEEGLDRYSAIPVIPLDSRQTVESADKITMVYSGGMVVFEDIEYVTDAGTIFLPAGGAGLGGIIWSLGNENNVTSMGQPTGVYFYNNQRYDIPIRYVQTAGGLVDFEKGLDAVVKIIPSFDGKSINQWGAAIYLSPRVSKSLFAQLYLLDDAFGNYGDMKVAHKEADGLVGNIKSQGGVIGDFIYYRGFRGPIKIWEVDYPDNTLERPEFFNRSGDWAEFDDLEFTE